MNEIRQEEYEIQNFVNEVLNPSFPNWALKSFGTFKKVNSKANTFFGEASTREIFEETPYKYTGNGHFLHFTSLSGIEAILESGWLRMSEFRNLEDEKELTFGINEILNSEIKNYLEGDIQSLKETLFCLSACEATDANKVDYHLWKNYGDQRRGVLIEYEFSNIDVHNYLLGEIRYGIECFEQLKTVRDNYIKYRSLEIGIYPSNFLQLLLEILVFHKEDKFKSEKEIRLFKRFDKARWEKHDNFFVYEGINQKKEERYFAKLFLKGRNPFFAKGDVSDLMKNEILGVIPQVEIKKITLGSNISIEKKLKINESLCGLKKKHNYEYSIFHLNTDSEILPFF